MKPILEEKNIKNNINIAVQRLLDGNLVIVPTETVYGIGADATNSAAVKKIYHILLSFKKMVMASIIWPILCVRATRFGH